MINVETEELFPLNAAPKHIPPGRTGRRVHVATIHRWCSPRGVGGVQLETVKIGGVRYTSVEAIERFIERCTQGDATEATHTSRRRRREIEKAEAELNAAGI